MRVITGSAKGRVLETPEGEDVRPTTDRVKEAIFSIIQFEIEGRKVLDLFGGSGQLGIEALSRGAERATFIDSDKRSIQIIRNNLERTKLSDSASVLQTDSISFIGASPNKFDIVFLDPPYGTGLLQRAIPLVSMKMNAGGVIVCESPLQESLPEEAGEYKLFREYKHGKIKVSVYRDTE